MYMYICEHAYVWDEQKGEGGKTPGCRLTVGRRRVLKPFPTARPSPASLQSSLHPPLPCFGQCTNITNTCMLRSATLGSTLRRWSHLQRVDGFAQAETTRVPRSQSPQPCSPVCCVCLRACTGGNPAAGTRTPCAVERAHLPACCTPLLRHALLRAAALDAVRHHLVEAGSPLTQAHLEATVQPSARSCVRAAYCSCDTHCCALLLSMPFRRLLRSSFDHREPVMRLIYSVSRGFVHPKTWFHPT